MSFDIVVCGIGGQGVITLGKIITNAALQSNLDVSLSENRGHAKRNDSVSCHVRIGKTYSPVIPKNTADLVIALDAEEILRHKTLVNGNSSLIVANKGINDFSEMDFEKVFDLKINSLEQIKNLNLFILGAITNLSSFPLSKENLQNSISQTMNDNAKSCLNAFNLGCENNDCDFE